MPRLVCIHEVELAEGADPAEFERLFTEGAAELTLPGWKVQLLSGDRGVRAGKYAYLMEIESVDARDRFFPQDGAESEEFDRWLAEHPGAADVLQQSHALQSGPEVTTDYLVVAD
jgi:hypothetical protein